MAGREHPIRPRSYNVQKHKGGSGRRSQPTNSATRFIDVWTRQDDDATENSRSTAVSNPFRPLNFPSHDAEHTVDITDNGGSPFRTVQRGQELIHSSNYDDESPLLAKGFQPVTSIPHETPFGSPVQRPRFRKHAPVPATVLFAPAAAPLYLPKLDKYLASYPSPRLPQIDDPNAPFPPMGNLAKLGMSFDDLETNSRQIPAWRSRKTILGSAVNIMLGLMGSSVLASFYSLQGLSNTVQIFALILSTIVPIGGQDHLQDKWRRLFLGTIPNILALNLGSTVAQPLIFLVLFMAIAAGLLYQFYRSTSHCDRYATIEGLRAPYLNDSQWRVIIVTFLLTIIYLPLSTMAVHVLVWSQDLWVVPNPYTGISSSTPTPLGPASEYRDPLDFCWTTTMKKNEVNYAPMTIILSVVVIFFLTIWFPIALHSVIKKSVPKVDRYSELGRARNDFEMDQEYQRLLSRDQNPFAFLYSGFRRNWGTYEPIYLVAKLNTLIIVAVIDVNNCLFRSLSSSRVPIVRQVFLLVSTISFFVAQCIFVPFLDPVNNASEWVSRLNYVTTSIVALAVAFDIPGKDIWNTYVLYVVYIITYGFTFYFTIINTDFVQRAVKRLTRRIDFSIDIFSPRLDISSSSIHTKRRIWQESITTLLLTTPECAIPVGQRMMFAEARYSEFPPYLLDFRESPGERHVENLKILRDVGIASYNKAIGLVSDRENSFFGRLEDQILSHFIGPDCYWKNPDEDARPDYSSYFGNAWWIPFPPTLVIRYDLGLLAVLKTASEFEAYISQNQRREIQRWRQVRLSLRALEGQTVAWPYEHITTVGDHSSWLWAKTHFRAKASAHHSSCTLRIQRRGHLAWQGIQLGSGFDVELCYTKQIILTGDAIGLNDGHDLTALLARFLKTNQVLISEKLQFIEESLSGYRLHYRHECRRKHRVLSYRFLSHVYDRPRPPGGLTESSIAVEHDPRVHRLMSDNEAVFEIAYERLLRVSVSETATWWYILWDDIWRRNHVTVTGLERHASDFSPYFPTSIAYTPLPRASLESFLAQRGLFSKNNRSNAFFTSGFLNKLYLRLNDTAFRASNQAIMFHLGDGPTELEMEEVDLETQGRPSTLGTGVGTDHNAPWILPRPAYRWEGLLSDPPYKEKKEKRRWFSKLGAWLGLTPLWRSGLMSSGISLDVRLDGGQYVVIEEEEEVNQRLA